MFVPSLSCQTDRLNDKMAEKGRFSHRTVRKINLLAPPNAVAIASSSLAPAAAARRGAPETDHGNQKQQRRCKEDSSRQHL
jgi:hypothetical protein